MAVVNKVDSVQIYNPQIWCSSFQLVNVDDFVNFFFLLFNFFVGPCFRQIDLNELVSLIGILNAVIFETTHHHLFVYTVFCFYKIINLTLKFQLTDQVEYLNPIYEIVDFSHKSFHENDFGDRKSVV